MGFETVWPSLQVWPILLYDSANSMSSLIAALHCQHWICQVLACGFHTGLHARVNTMVVHSSRLLSLTALLPPSPCCGSQYR
jgi:hypothetical protein